MLEISEDVPTRCLRLQILADGGQIGRRIIPFAQTITAERGRQFGRRAQFITLCNAERGAMVAQSRVDRVAEPGGVSELEGKTKVESPRLAKEVSEQVSVCLHIRWQLKQDHPETGRFSNRRDRAREAFQRLRTILQT